MELHIRAVASSGVPEAVCGESEAGVAADSDGGGVLAVCGDWRGADEAAH
jgi:hypothetical protein